MTDRICETIEKADGILHAYSWPTGLRNNGPEEYAIYYDSDVISYESVVETLRTAVMQHSHDSIGFYISTGYSDPCDETRVNEHRHRENEDHPAVIAARYTHELSQDLIEIQRELDDELIFWGVEWEPYANTDQIDDPEFLSVHRDAGTLTVYFELKNDSRYDTVLNMIHDAVYPMSLNVVQGDSDGYHVEITSNT